MAVFVNNNGLSVRYLAHAVGVINFGFETLNRNKTSAATTRTLPMISMVESRSPSRKKAISVVKTGSSVRIRLAVLEGSKPKLML